MIGDVLTWYLPWTGGDGALRIIFFDWLVFLALPVSVLWGVARLSSWRHARSLQARESLAGRPFVCTTDAAPAGYGDPRLVVAGIVNSHAVVRALSVLVPKLFGWRIAVLDRMARRARREALLRLEDSAIAQGADVIVGLRMVSRGAGFRADDRGLSIEVVVYGTALSRLPATSR